MNHVSIDLPTSPAHSEPPGRRIARTIVISQTEPYLTIDGDRFEFAVDRDWNVTLDGIARLNCSILAEHIEVVG